MFLFSSDGSGFESAGAVGELAFGDLSDHDGFEQWQFPRRRGGEVAAERQHHADGTGEAESHRVGVVFIGGLQHEASDDVQGRHPGGEFLPHAVGGLAAKYIGVQVDLQIAEQYFDAPATGIEFDNLLGGIHYRIE